MKAAITKRPKPSPQPLQGMLATAKTVKMKAATRDDLNGLIEQLGSAVDKAGTSKEERVKAVRAVLQQVSKGDPNRLRELFARGYLDALKSPSQLRSGNRSVPRNEPRRK